MAVTAPAASLASALLERVVTVLVDTAIVVGDQATWLTPQLAGPDDPGAHDDGTATTVGRTGVACLYDGSAGIGWALAVVGARSQRTDLLDLAGSALRHAVARAEVDPRPGLYDGTAGVGLAAVAGGDLCADAALEAAGVRLLRRAGAATPASDDLIDGTAGLALACRRGAQLTGDERLSVVAHRQAATLIARADRRAWGWCWPSGGGPALCGLAHGAAGAAWALGEVAAAGGHGPMPHGTASQRQLTTARDAARRFERSWFDPRTSTWPDLREDVAGPDADPPRPSLWCHGGVGIALSRLALHAVDPHPSLLGEAVAARGAALRDATTDVTAGRLPSGLTVCHGLGGTLTLLLAVADQLEAPEYREAAVELLSAAVDHLGDDPLAWPGGLLAAPGPGLMTGLAGTLLVLAGMDDPGALAPLTRLGV